MGVVPHRDGYSQLLTHGYQVYKHRKLRVSDTPKPTKGRWPEVELSRVVVNDVPDARSADRNDALTAAPAPSGGATTSLPVAEGTPFGLLVWPDVGRTNSRSAPQTDVF